MVLLDALFSYDKAFYVWKTSMHLALEQQVLPYTSMYLMPMFWHEKWTAISKHCEAMELKRYDWESILMSSTLEHKRHPIAQGSRHSRKSCHLQSKTNWDQSFCTCITVPGQTLPHNCKNVHWYSHIPSKKSGLHGCICLPVRLIECIVWIWYMFIARSIQEGRDKPNSLILSTALASKENGIQSDSVVWGHKPFCQPSGASLCHTHTRPTELVPLRLWDAGTKWNFCLL